MCHRMGLGSSWPLPCSHAVFSEAACAHPVRIAHKADPTLSLHATPRTSNGVRAAVQAGRDDCFRELKAERAAQGQGWQPWPLPVALHMSLTHALHACTHMGPQQAQPGSRCWVGLVRKGRWGSVGVHGVGSAGWAVGCGGGVARLPASGLDGSALPQLQCAAVWPLLHVRLWLGTAWLARTWHACALSLFAGCDEMCPADWDQ